MQNDVVIIAAYRAITPDNSFPHGYRLSSQDKLVKHIHTPFLAIFDHQLICKDKMNIWAFICCILFLMPFSKALRLPKFYTHGMVLQADPTEAIIWGFLDGNQNEVSISATCRFQKTEMKFVKIATNLKVRI